VPGTRPTGPGSSRSSRGTDISTRRASVERELERLSAIVGSSDDAIISASLEGVILSWNPAAERLYGYAEADILGTPISITVPPDRQDEMQRSLETIRNGEAVDHLETEHIRKDGSRTPVSITMSPLKEAGGVVGVSALVTDITQRKQIERELARSFTLLRKAAEDRQELLRRLVSAEEEERARISGQLHDDTIQMMTAVGLRLEKLRAAVEPSQASELEQVLGVVSNAVDRLRRLMIELHPRTLDQDGLAAAIREQFAVANEGGWMHSLQDDLSREPDPVLRHVAYRIALEALTNAHKHARADQISVGLRDEGAGFTVTIWDDGIGISPEQVLGSPLGHIGLASMRERAETANGSFTIGPAPEGGTVVEFWLPYEAQPERFPELDGMSSFVTAPGTRRPPRGLRR
jgi:PAS domain S-box-containing protein